MKYLTRLIMPTDNRRDFTSGKPALDDYIRKQATQDIKKKLSVCFVLPGNNDVIKGYYTLSNISIQQIEIPAEIRKKMPKSYPDLPATLLGRLAVDAHFRGRGLGELLLIDALKRSCDVSAESIGSMAVIVHPLDVDAENFYIRYGFIKLPDSRKLFLPMKTIEKLFS